MKKILVLLTAVSFLSVKGISQSAKKETTDTAVGSEYIPVEGHTETSVPAELQGSWILTSGIKRTKSPDFQSNKSFNGSEKRMDSVTTTSTVNGETHTTTEVNIERMAVPAKQITPQQKDNMHKAEKPGISFYGLNGTFSGFTGCNKYSGRYNLKGNKITLLDVAASTKMVCIGEYDEKDFLNALQKVNSFKSANGNLQLLDGNEVVLVFSRK